MNRVLNALPSLSTVRAVVVFAATIGAVQLFNLVSPSVAAPSVQPITPMSTLVTLSPEKFDAWLQSNQPRDSSDYSKIQLYTDVLQNRISHYIFTSDDAILTIVKFSSNPEDVSGKEASNIGPDGLHYPKTRALISSIIGHLYGRPVIVAELHRFKAQLFINRGDLKYAQAADEYRNAINILVQNQFNGQFGLVSSELELGHMLYAQGDVKDADAQFLAVMSYDYPSALVMSNESSGTESSSSWLQKFQDVYVAASEGLIACRSGNLDALKEINILPTVADMVNPLLTKAINEAQHSQAALKHGSTP